MLRQLAPQDIEKRWKPIGNAVARCLPPQEVLPKQALANVRAGLLSGKLQCWMVAGDNKQVNAVVVTGVYTDAVTGIKALLVYTLFVARKLSTELWKETVDGLNKFAKSLGCVGVVSIRPLGGA